MVEIEKQELDKWNAHCVEQYPNEACALVVDNKVIIVPNQADDKEHTFAIKVQDFWQYHDKIQAVLHSHCVDTAKPLLLDPRTPSKADMTGQKNHGVWWGITATEGEETTPILWFGFDRGEPYEGRTFIHNVADCFELVRDYYRREYSHEIGQYCRQWDWFETENLFDDYFTAEGFVEVSIDQIEPGDVVFFGIRSEKTNHIGVYVGNDRFLHHLTNRFSEYDTLARWRRHVLRVVRRKQ